MSMEFVKLSFVLTREDACAIACIAEQYGTTVPLIIRRIVQAEIRRREENVQGVDFSKVKRAVSSDEKKE